MRKIFVVICLAFALTLIGGGLFWFQNLLIPEPQEIKIFHQKRLTPALKTYQIRACKKAPYNSYDRNSCINSVFDI